MDAVCNNTEANYYYGAQSKLEKFPPLSCATTASLKALIQWMDPYSSCVFHYFFPSRLIKPDKFI